MESDVHRISSLEDIAQILEHEGYEFSHEGESVRVKIGGADHPFIAVITCAKDKQEMSITCQVARLGDIPEARIPQFLAACLEANTRITPYAFGLITVSDNPELDNEQEWLIVLIDSLSLGDLNEMDFIRSMDGLWVGLEASRQVLANALTEV